MRALSLPSLTWLTLLLLLAPLGCGSDPRDPAFEPFENSVLELAQARGNLAIFVELVEVASLGPLLTRGTQNTTVLAPTDLAFGDLPGGRLDQLRKKPAEAKDLLFYHLVPGRRKLNLITISDKLPTLLYRKKAPVEVTVRVDMGAIVVGGSGGSEGRIIAGELSDQPGNNGLLHTIDAVLTPPPKPPQS